MTRTLGVVLGDPFEAADERLPGSAGRASHDMAVARCAASAQLDADWDVVDGRVATDRGNRSAAVARALLVGAGARESIKRSREPGYRGRPRDQPMRPQVPSRSRPVDTGEDLGGAAGHEPLIGGGIGASQRGGVVARTGGRWVEGRPGALRARHDRHQLRSIGREHRCRSSPCTA